METRKQINIRLTDEIREAIDDIRAAARPIMSMSDVIRVAVLEKRDAIKKATGRRK